MDVRCGSRGGSARGAGEPPFAFGVRRGNVVGSP